MFSLSTQLRGSGRRAHFAKGSGKPPDELTLRTGNDLRMTATVNGRPYREGNFADIHWSFAKLVEYASRHPLRTGDVIGSDTVGTGCILELSRSNGGTLYPWLVPGDEVSLTVAHLGTIASTIVE